MSLSRLWIGVDWGTHSSKWWFTAQDSRGQISDVGRANPVVDSTLHRVGSSLMLAYEGTRLQSDCSVARLKRHLIENPLGPDYWEAAWRGTGLSLGDAATLCLATLLGDVATRLEEQKLGVDAETRVSVRFSLPNWISNDLGEQVARQNMFQTTAVVMALLASDGWAGLPRVGNRVRAEDWQRKMKQRAKELQFMRDHDIPIPDVRLTTLTVDKKDNEDEADDNKTNTQEN